MLSRTLTTALALAAAAVHAQRTCTQSAEPYRYPEHNTKSVNATTSQTCQGLCATSDCVAYLFGDQNGAPKCVHYDAVSRAAFAVGIPILAPAGWVSGRCGTQLPLVNGDFPGNDIGNVPAPDATQCSYRCDETRGCNAFSWSKYNGGTCWMKTAQPSAPTTPFDGSVVSGEAFKCEMFEKGRDIVGGDLTSVPRTNWRECCGVCRRTERCSASTWSDYNGGTCWLKTTTLGGLTQGPEGLRSMDLISE